MPRDTEGFAERFRDRGYLPAIPLLGETDLAHFRSMPLEDKRISEANTAKALWRIDETTRRAARHPQISAILDELVGERGYFLYGAQLIDRVPGQDHPWHTDVDTAREGFVSIWIGIDGVTAETSLQVFPGSHLLGDPVQAIWKTDDPALCDPDAVEILAYLRGKRSEATLDRPECSDGHAIFFDGRLWHGTFNRTEAPRRALLLQYGRHGTPVRWVRTWGRYPFDYDPDRTPMVLSLKGSPDPIANKNFIPDKNGRPSLPAARTGAGPELAPAEGRAWTMHPYFRTETPIMVRLTCHASVLRGGYMPHTPHAHEDEEILIVLSGKALIMSQAGGEGALRAQPAGSGDVFYYPQNHAHTIMNASLREDAEPVAYLMFRWRTRRDANGSARPFRVPRQAYSEPGRRFSVDRPSSGLGKLHMHFSRLEPGTANPRHIDRYDSTFVVLSGHLTVMGRSLGPGGAFLTRAGELHDTANTADAPCEYLVFEYHDMVD